MVSNTSLALALAVPISAAVAIPTPEATPEASGGSSSDLTIVTTDAAAKHADGAIHAEAVYVLEVWKDADWRGAGMRSLPGPECVVSIPHLVPQESRLYVIQPDYCCSVDSFWGDWAFLDLQISSARAPTPGCSCYVYESVIPLLACNRQTTVLMRPTASSSARVPLKGPFRTTISTATSTILVGVTRFAPSCAPDSELYISLREAGSLRCRVEMAL